MLMDKLRDGAQSKIAKIIFWLIILSFALAGVGSYLNRPASNDPAVVDDEVISAQTLEQSYQNERSRMQAQYGEAASKLLGNPQYLAQLKKSVLERLVNQALLNHQATKAGIRLGDEQIKDVIRQMPEFQTDNKFDNKKFIAALSRVGYTPESFANSMRQDLARQFWLDGVLTTDFVLPSEIQTLESLYQQKRDVEGWKKGPMDDLVSMQTGIFGYKGHVHYHAAPCIDEYLDTLDPEMPKQELFNTIAAHIDHEIHSHYRLYPGNYVALDLLENTEAHASEYTLEDKARFEKYIAGQLAKIELPDKDEAFLKEKILAMYANPVRNFLATK